MKKFLPFLCVGVLMAPFLVSAETKDIKAVMMSEHASMQPVYETCKKTALLHKERIMRPALKEYRQESDQITTTAKNSFEKISWYINTSYKANSRRILDEKENAMRALSAKIANARKTAHATYQAEIALCEMNNPEAHKEKSASVVTKNTTN